jgi:hypothetical protein
MINTVSMFTIDDVSTAAKSSNFNKGLGPDCFDGNMLKSSVELNEKILDGDHRCPQHNESSRVSEDREISAASENIYEGPSSPRRDQTYCRPLTCVKDNGEGYLGKDQPAMPTCDCDEDVPDWVQRGEVDGHSRKSTPQ